MSVPKVSVSVTPLGRVRIVPYVPVHTTAAMSVSVDQMVHALVRRADPMDAADSQASSVRSLSVHPTAVRIRASVSASILSVSVSQVKVNPTVSTMHAH